MIILFLSVGYALLNEKLSINATGVVGVPSGPKLNEVVLANELPTLNTGDGLYNYNSKYYFSGASVNNYVMYNDEVWRIVSIEEDGGIKIVKDTIVDQQTIANLENETSFWTINTNNNTNTINNVKNQGRIIFDFKGRRPIDKNLENSYCDYTKNGCNAYDKGTIRDLTIDEASLLKIYLETVFFPNMTPLAKSQVQNYDLNIGIVETNKKINVVLSSEKTNTTNSFIGLLNISDYVYATQDTTCRNSFDKEACATSNWLMLENYQFYIQNGKYVSGNAQVWTITSAGKITSQDANNPFYLRPVVVLNKNITATGSGTPTDMYILGAIS